jgi:hypothetical protein
MSSDDPERVMGSAVWDGTKIAIQADDDAATQKVWRIFRPTAVAVDDPSWRAAGSAGPVVYQPGSLRWFQAAARVRAEAEGLRARFVPTVTGALGWEPAGAYRPFTEAVERIVRSG